MILFMEKEDARKNPFSLYERRKQVAHLHRNGYGPMKIVELTGLSWGAVNTAINLYKEGGVSALEPKTRGRRKGMCRTLNESQERRIQQLICEKHPESLNMDFALWTRVAVKELICRELGIDLPIRSVGDYLYRWRFISKKPVKRAYEQQPKTVQVWLDEEYPEIEKRAIEERAEIHWGDETSFMDTCVRGCSDLPQSEMPETCAVWGGREKFSMVTSVTNRGKWRWIMIDGAFNSDRLIEFMGLLIKDVGRKVFLLLDNPWGYHSQSVMGWLEWHTDKIEVFFLPSDSLEYMPSN